MARVNLAAFRGLGRWLALIAALLGLCFASVFAGRRFIDRWEQTLSGAELLLLTAALGGALFGFRRVWRDAPITSHGPPGDVAFHAIPTLTALLLAAAVSSSQSPLWGIIFLWTVLSSLETWFWTGAAQAFLHRRPSAGLALIAPDPMPQPAPSEAEDAADDDGFPSDHLQQITRFRDEGGAEIVQGALRAELALRQRVHHLHIAFCPPLPSVPEFAFEQTDGPEATLTAGQVETYGARIDLRLAAPSDEGQSVVVEFYARCEAA
jgi:hypothetical protein